jgi:hypothetical protein
MLLDVEPPSPVRYVLGTIVMVLGVVCRATLVCLYCFTSIVIDLFTCFVNDLVASLP